MRRKVQEKEKDEVEMNYLRSFTFPSRGKQENFLLGIKRTCYDSYYPFMVLAEDQATTLTCDPITILYGGNGSGKTTVLHVMAEKLELKQGAVQNTSDFLGDYVAMCEAELAEAVPAQRLYIASDDVFDYMLNIRLLNQGIDRKREALFDEYLEAKYAHFQMRSLADYEALKRSNAAKGKTQSKYVRSRLMKNVREQSNGESAFMYFTEHIEDNGLYLLDEPENSLSPERQIQLAHFIEDAARFFGCQFIIATHSPFLLAMKGAKIYDLESTPITTKKWTLLSNVRQYF